MKKSQITIGGIYAAKVSGRLVPVAIVQENPLGGWNGINLQSHRGVRIRTAARLRPPMGLKPLPLGTRVSIDIAQGLAIAEGVVAEACYDDNWMYRIDITVGDKCNEHRNAAGELWLNDFELKPPKIQK
jgi:hypothetical protein